VALNTIRVKVKDEKVCFYFIVNINLSEQWYALTVLTLCVNLQFIMYFTVIILLWPNKNLMKKRFYFAISWLYLNQSQS
jgi:hypothetical protein